MPGFIYMWVNKLNSKKYIGSHIGTLDDGYIASGPIFLKALEKYGIDNFERIILEHVDNNTQILEREDYYLKLFNVANDKQFYNCRDRAGGGFEYINANPIFRAKQNESHKQWFKCNNHPKGMQGKKHTEEHRAKLREYAAKNNEVSKRPVIQYDMYGNKVAEYDSLVSAAKAVRGGASNIKYAIEGKFQTAYKHKWVYKEV